MRYRRKETGCEVRYSELDARALEYIEELGEDGNEEFDGAVENNDEDAIMSV